MHDADFLSALCLFIADVWVNKKIVYVRLSDGSTLEGQWHQDFEQADCSWTGRCFELSKA